MNKKYLKYYCIDCNKKIYAETFLYGRKRCKSCAKKGKFNCRYKTKIKGKESSNWKGGITKRKYYCIDCETKISLLSKYFGNKRCSSCDKKFRYKNSKNHPNWQGGLGKLPYSFEFNNNLKLKIRTRDNFQCKNCNMTEEEHIIVYGKVLSVHHIDYNKENSKETNLTSLCNGCNLRVNANRDYWYSYFTYIMEKKHEKD